MSSAKILLIENDQPLARSLKELLIRQNWQVTVVSSLTETWKILDKQQFDLAIVDRILDDGDGLEIISYLRSLQHPMRLLCLTSKGHVTERIKGWEAGTDDYLPKPFSSQELLLRIKNLLSKYKQYQPKNLVCDALSLNPDTGYFTGPEQGIYLRKRESQILGCLFRHQKAVVTRQMLLDELWPGATSLPEDSTLDVYVRRLRIGLKQYGSAIKTVRGFGYMLKP